MTGATGFIGCQVVRDLRAAGAQVLGIDDERVGHNALEAHPAVSFVRADFTSANARHAIACFVPDAVVHLAALHYVPYCREHPAETIAVNVHASRRLLQFLGQLESVRRVVFASSAAVYGYSDQPITERTAPRPVDVYGASKLQGEALVRDLVARQPAISAATLRFFNVFGKHETNPHLIPTLLEQIARGTTVAIGNPWPRRDYVHVRDVSRAVCLALEAELDDPMATFDIATGRGTSVEQVLEILAAHARTPVHWRLDPVRVRLGDGHLVGTGSRAREMLGWAPTETIESGLAELCSEGLVRV